MNRSSAFCLAPPSPTAELCTVSPAYRSWPSGFGCSAADLCAKVEKGVVAGVSRPTHVLSKAGPHVKVTQHIPSINTHPPLPTHLEEICCIFHNVTSTTLTPCRVWQWSWTSGAQCVCVCMYKCTGSQT